MKHLNLFNSNSEYELHKNSSQYVTPEVSFIEETSTVFYVPKQELYEFVDLGLPSGTKWATTNVGAEKPEDFGLYFQWGETEGVTDPTTNPFVWDTYKYHISDGSKFSKYVTQSQSGIVDNLTTLEQVDDAAYRSDNTCRMPTKTDFEELIANTANKWETLNGVNGKRFTSKKNGNSIFLPAAGYCSGNSVTNVGSDGYYWSSLLFESIPNSSWFFLIFSGYVGMDLNYRCQGFSVRPVKSN